MKKKRKEKKRQESIINQFELIISHPFKALVLPSFTYDADMGRRYEKIALLCFQKEMKIYI